MRLPSLNSQPPAVHAAFLIVTLAPLYYVSYRYRLARLDSGPPSIAHNARPPSTDFVRDWLNTQLIEPVNLSPLSTYCNRTEWHPNLVFHLANANGGIGNIRGNLLDFVFQAIEAGASFVLPGMATRSAEDLSNVWASRAPFDTFFDEEWFLHELGQACPQMAVYKPQPGQQMAKPLPGTYLPRSRRIDVDTGNARVAYLQHLDAWLKEKTTFAPDKLALVNLERTLWDIDTRSLPQGFRRNFGQILRIKPAIRRLAAVVLQNMAEQYTLRLDPRDAIPSHAFYGAHLRTEADASQAGWLDEPNGAGNFSTQTDAYLAHALDHDLRTIYVATGNASELRRFAAKGAAHRPPVNVTSKFDILQRSHSASSKEALAALRELSWDQQALVDYEVLQRASVFGGVVKSSFSYNVAMTRFQRLEDEGRVVEPWRVVHTQTGVAFDDGVSRVLGRDAWHEARIPRGMWP